MKVTFHHYANVIVTIYQLNRGEKITKHIHPNSHTTNVAAGKSEVEIWDKDQKTSQIFQMVANGKDYELPPSQYHEVRSLEDNTICVHITERTNTPYTPDIPIQKNGGVMLHDGTIVYE